MSGSKILVAAALAVAVVPASAWAFINFDLTPKDLYDQSDAVLLLEFKSVAKDGNATAAVVEVLKGEFKDKEVIVDLTATAFEQQGKEVAAVIEGGQKQGLMWIGTYRIQGEGGMQQEPQEKAFVHMACPRSSAWQWIVLTKPVGGVWGLEKSDAFMLGTWAGGTDMLLRLIRLMKADESIDIPVQADAEWAEPVKAGSIPGKVFGAEPVDLAGGGACDLFLAAEGGDRLLRWTGNGLVDVTGKLALKAASACFTWADLNGDGKLDLASWDGKRLSVAWQQADGTFQTKPCDVGAALKDGCLGLAVLEWGDKGRPALLASTKGSPVVLLPQADGPAQATPLATGELPAKDLGEPRHCLVADLDADGLPDVLQLFVGGSLLYKGKAPGAYAGPEPVSVAVGRGRFGAGLGDYDGDGLLEVMVAGEDRNRLWHNLGGGKYAELLSLSGEMAYIAKPGGIVAQTGDVNNDGRADILIAYGSQMTPHLFFNRGFRSTGHARELDLQERKLVPEAGEGQQAGCLGDLNGDGALDMALVLANGEIWVFPRKVEGKALAAVVSLSAGAPHAGPVNVVATQDKRQMGAWPVRAGGPPALIGVKDPGAGPVVLSWQWPGQPATKMELTVEKPVRVVLDKTK